MIYCQFSCELTIEVMKNSIAISRMVTRPLIYGHIVLLINKHTQEVYGKPLGS